MINLKNKNVILTGATGGIGNSIADTLISLNANLIVSGTNQNKLDELKNKHKNLITLKQDISAHDELEEFIEKCNSEFGSCIDVLINNAGITRDNLTIRMEKKEWQDVINVNLTSTFLLSKFAIKKMLKKKFGKIINITSIVGHTGNLGQSNYSASKAGIIGFSKSLAIEYARKNINVNCVSPGFIQTEMTDKINEEFKKNLINQIPSGTLGTGEDVSNCVAFLASDMANYINGETIHVNGGMYMA